MNTISAELKSNLNDHLSSGEKTYAEMHTPAKTNDKFMHHFETINRISQGITDMTTGAESKGDKFETRMEKYSNMDSFVDRVINMNQDLLPVNALEEKIVQPPIVPGLKVSSRQTVDTISQMFQGVEMKENNDYFSNKLPVMEVLSEQLRDLGRSNKVQQNKQLAKSKAIIKTPTYQDLNAPLGSSELHIMAKQSNKKEFQMETQQLQIHRHSNQKFRKKDLILMEILHQKKRKSFSPDYFAIMELKLMELLDFILQDQHEYIGLDPQIKIKTVLKNLESFQGKTIESESKINLLRIFFEEFTSLKHEKEQQEMLSKEVLKTPMRKLDNKDHFQAPTTTKMKETKQSLSTTPQRKMAGSKVKKEKQPQFAWIENSYGHPVKKPVKGGNDEWIGSM